MLPLSQRTSLHLREIRQNIQKKHGEDQARTIKTLQPLRPEVKYRSTKRQDSQLP